MKEHSKIREIAFLGDYLPRNCGIATFTSDLITSVAAAYHFRAIGTNGFYQRGGVRADFGRQTIEEQAMASACLEAYRATSDVWWYEQAQCAFDWFLGWNDLGLELYSPKPGGCREGLHVDLVDRKQGAGSTLAFLLSLAEMRLAQNMRTSFEEPIAVAEE